MNRSRKFDFLIIGGGPGGTPATMALGSAGKRVLLVNAGPGLGGTCLFEGCIPSKIFWETSRRLQDIRDAAAFGINIPEGTVTPDWSVVIARKKAILTGRSEGALQTVRKLPGVDVVMGRAMLLGPRRARVAPASGEEPFEVEFGQAVLATGSAPHLPPLPGIDLPQVLTSEGMLEIDHIPESLAVIGGGPIGMEMAHIFHGLGSRVHVLEMAPRILGPIDEELAIAMEEISRRKGIELSTSVNVTGLEESGDRITAAYTEEDGSTHSLSSERVLAVTGRRPVVDGLGLENTSVRHDHGGIVVDENLETGEPGIFAVGDAAGVPMFANWATAQGLALARHLLGQPVSFPTPSVNTDVIFTIPEVGIAGLTKAEAEREGLEVEEAKYPYKIDGRAQISGHAEGMLKFVFEPPMGRIVGVHILSEGAGDLLGEAALIVRKGMTVREVASSIHPHPTWNESFGILARSIMASST